MPATVSNLPAVITRSDIQPLIAHLSENDAQAVQHAWDFAFTLYAQRTLSSGETMSAHALGLLTILDQVRADATARIAGILFGAAGLFAQPKQQLSATFNAEIAELVISTQQLARVGDVARNSGGQQQQEQLETLRNMLLAFASDIRVVLIRLASRLQTLRYSAREKISVTPAFAQESLHLYASLANRLGIGQIKWELEDLAFRFIDPETYRHIARALDEKRVERETFIRNTIDALHELLSRAGIVAEITGRPKHIYSIYNKMRHKGVAFDQLYDVRALRVIVADEETCYSALGIIHDTWTSLPEEFDDYISRPKPNNYRSLHTVVFDAQNRPFEIQIRTKAMHRFAEYGVAAHWRYKESGNANNLAQTARIEEKINWLRQLLAWKNQVADSATSLSSTSSQPTATGELIDPYIYVLTPQGRVIELVQGATAIDFAYALHSDLGHRCRGAHVDGALVSLNTPLKNGQTIEIVAAKSGGPSRDWLNPQLGFLRSNRARAKVRQWFNNLEIAETTASGRALLEKILQRIGKTEINLDELAKKLAFSKTDELYIALGKDELSARQIELAVNNSLAATTEVLDPLLLPKRSHTTSVAAGAQSGVLVVGLNAIMTQLAKCCKPAPPDEIVGFVTRGKGISIHRAHCKNLQTLRARAPERVIETTWGDHHEAFYPIDILVSANDRQGLLRDISEILAREKMNLTGVNTQSSKGLAHMAFTIEIANTTQLQRALDLVRQVAGVFDVRRKS